MVGEVNVDVNQSNVALMTFSDQVVIDFHLDVFHKRLFIKNATGNAQFLRGTTDRAAALKAAREQIFV